MIFFLSTKVGRSLTKDLIFLPSSLAAALHLLCISLFDRRVVALSAPAPVQITSLVLLFVRLLSVCSFYFVLRGDPLVPNRLGLSD